jgi:hypothetical protein
VRLPLPVRIGIQDRDEGNRLPANEFNSLNEVVLAAENNVSICFGIAAISLWDAIAEKNVYSAEKLPNPPCDLPRKTRRLDLHDTVLFRSWNCDSQMGFEITEVPDRLHARLEADRPYCCSRNAV